MKKIAVIFCLMITASMAVHAQGINPANWSFSSKKIKAGLYEIHMTAQLNPGWAIYSQSTPSGGPLPTKFNFKTNPQITLDGKIKEVGTMDKKYEEVFGVDVLYYKNKVDFVQRVKLKKNVPATLSGTVEFMVCNTHRCLPPHRLEFNVSLK